MDTPKLFETAIAELERMLSSKTVVGDPITVDNSTIVPLVSVGFGFGVGAGEGSQAGGRSRGQGGATAGGGGVKPVAVLIADDKGTRLESINVAATVLGKVAESVTEIAREKLAAPKNDEPSE